ncbi:ORC ubiquitin ligase 1-like isoform X2 [Mercenaria mercenaria]|uniref:ORC ubiquitin ligase 1-like isoform X2 n=1 Tax=Mercenaria mercenaria TaxID=6596 RepID=UPI00234E9168|nr:ORC ubiquitin ligase 1-like isoform X2 [Mercenaria mercenaria]
MAAEVNARSNKNSTIAFTLPISCQVCLGKVKNPVLCPNQHVFCGPCMEVWLQKNKQCPACRTAMTAGKKIIGGLSHQEEDTDKMTNPDLRKARFDLLYKEYENEFERMHSEIQLLKTENQILKQQARKDGLQPGRSESGSSKATDSSHLLALTKKLQDATKMYEKVKGEQTRLKQENTNLKDENLSLNRENQHLRQELAGRSPHRYGRITVSTLETKLASAEKDVTRLTKALERSDKYIEELEAELDDYRGKSGSSKRPSSASDRDDKHLTNGDIANRKYSSDSKVPPSREYGIGADNPSRRQLFSDDTGAKSSAGERSKYYYERNGDYNDDYKSDGRSQGAKMNGDNGGKKRVTFDLNKNTNSTMSFDLELPSPLKMSANASGLANGRASPVKGVLKKTNGASNKQSSSDKSGFSTDLSKDSLSDSYNLKSSDRYSKDDDLLFLKSRSRSSSDRDYEDDIYSKPRKKYSADDSVLDEPSDLDSKRTRDRDYSSRSRASDYESRKRSDLLDDLDSGPRRSRDARDRVDDLDKSDLDDTHYIESELDELNISLTPEFTDCMKILNRAEKNVHTRVTDPVTDDLAKYQSIDSEIDTAFRASTGSIGERSGAGQDFMSNVKTDTSKFTSSLDSYSRGRHVRSGSLDNIFVAAADPHERPSSALPTTSNMYSSNSQNRYMGGLTTGRTTLTRTPSLDNLLLARQSTGYQNKYSSVEDSLGLKSRSSFPGYMGRRSYGEEENKLDVKSGSLPSNAPVTAKHDILGSQGTGSTAGDRYSRVGTDSNAQGYSSDRMSSISASTKEMDIGRKLPPSGRQTPTMPLSSTGSDLDKQYSSGRVTPTIPTHSEYMAFSKSNTDKYTYTASTGSGRSTPTLTTNTDYTSLTKSSGPYSGPSSLPTDLSQKPPTGTRVPDFTPARSTTQGSSSSSLGLSSYPGPSSASSYLPTTLTSLTSSSSYSTAHSVPLTFTTSTYTSSLPANTYSSKGLDPIAESGHYSYVSNVSGDYSSKNDTFALPEPKKRLFENSDDLDMSVSPIKSNRRF